MIFNSIRWRLQLWHGLILIAVLVGFGITAYRVAEHNQLRALDQELDQQADRLLRPPPRMFVPPGGSPSFQRPSIGEFAERIQQLIRDEQAGTFYYVMWNGQGVMLAGSTGLSQGIVFPRELATR